MTLTSGARLGSYEIVAPLGAGGMGEVYRARDRKLGRDVAIKILPSHLQETPAARARFEREARAVAALSHPNVLAIYELGTDHGTAFAVTELLVGETLRERLGRGPASVRKVIDYGAQIAKGLAAAHDRGIIHRDLKPENVFVTQDGIVKVLDFGLARREHVSEHPGAATVSAMFHSEPGLVLGTVGYMSPEQVRGENADARSDIFSLGAVLYELLAGEPAFKRKTAAETMTAVLKEEPGEMKASSSGIATAVDRIVHRCLEKRPEDRFQSARDLAFHLENLVHGSALEMTPLAGTGRPRRRVRATSVGLACALAGLVGGIAMQRYAGSASVTAPAQVRRLTFSGYDSEPSMSPDGSVVAFASSRDGTPRIWVKQIAGGTEREWTAGPDWRPRFAPDGTAILFTHAGGDPALHRHDDATSIYQVSSVGGVARRIVENATEGDWSPDSQRVVFIRSRVETDQRASLLGVVGARGGAERILAEFAGWDLYGVRWCLDGRRIAVIRAPARGSATQQNELVLVDAATGGTEMVELPNRGGSPLSFPTWVAPDDSLVFALSADRAEIGDVAGALSRVVLRDNKGVLRTLLWAPNLFTTLGGARDYARFDVAGSGRLVFDQIEQEQHLREVTVGFAPGDSGGRVLTNGRSRDRQPAYSPDGQWVIFSSNRSGNLDLWKLNRATGELAQITNDPASDWDPAFAPDGRQIIWSSDRGGTLQVWVANVDGTGERRVTNDAVGAENPTATPDQRWIVYASDNPAPDAIGIWRTRLNGTQAKRLMAGTLFVPDVSPDGRFALVVESVATNREYRIRAVEIESARVVPFQVSVPFSPHAPNITWGRARWMPGGRSIAFVGLDERGRSGVFVQDFVPDRDTTSTRRVVAGFSRDFVTESLGVSPDGSLITISALEQSRVLMMAEGLDGIAPRARFGR